MRRHVVLSLAICCLALALLAALPGARAATPIPGCTDILVPYTPPAPPVTPAPPPSCVERPSGPGAPWALPIHSYRKDPSVPAPHLCGDGEVNHRKRCVPDGSPYRYWQVRVWRYSIHDPGECQGNSGAPGTYVCIMATSGVTKCGQYVGPQYPDPFDTIWINYDPITVQNHKLELNASCQQAILPEDPIDP